VVYADRKSQIRFASEVTGSTPVEVRGANALEFIAHYLDRIEGHLATIATQLEKGNVNGASVAQAMTQISHMFPRLVARQ